MMKAKHYLLGAALSLLAMGQTMAQQLSPEQARANAEAFLQQQTGLRSTSEHIYNVQGGLVATGSLSGTTARIDGSAWQTGIYIVAIETGEGKMIVSKLYK